MWRHCLEILVFCVTVAAAVAALVIALSAVFRAYTAAAPMREEIKLTQKKDETQHSEEYEKTLAEHWEKWRKKVAGYATDVNLIVNPLRRDTIDIIKESANWARLGVQYALIGNGGALVGALPYLLSSTTVRLSLEDAVWCALWFVVGLLAAAGTCLVAYMDFLVVAAINWNTIEVDYAGARQRHFETNDKVPVEIRMNVTNALRATNARTSVCGVALAAIAWLALAGGALRIIMSLVPVAAR